MIRTLIYGSCVSRDTFEFLDQRKFTLLRYVARQSLLSAFTPAPLEQMPEVSVASPFQRRMMVGDWVGSLTSDLAELAPKVDLILWDLCDERLGVRQLRADPDIFVTRSVESISSGMDATLASSPTWSLGEGQHLMAFEDSLDQLSDVLSLHGSTSKMVLVNPPWATQTTDGLTAPESFGWSAAQANATFDLYYQATLSALDVPSASVPQERAIADAQHQWGLAPFHYCPRTYQDLASQITERISSRRS